MAGRLGLTLRQYRAFEVGELWIDYDLYLRITEICGWPQQTTSRPRFARACSATCSPERGACPASSAS